MREITARELSKILKKHKKWRDTDENKGEKADLSHADLKRIEAHLRLFIKADLSNANLSGVDLSRADLRGADLSHADLSSADLSGANLAFANLSGANLSYANLSGIYGGEVNLRGANLREADLSRAILSFAKLAKVKNLSINKLSEVKNLYEAELDPELMEQVKDKYPHLLSGD